MHSGDITLLLQAWSRGDEDALHKLVPLVYAELKRQAGRYMNRERLGHTLQATALVHEAYTHLIRTPHVNWQDRNHFYAICARLMRRVLVDHSRSRGYQKRGGPMTLVSLDDVPDIGQDGGVNLLDLDRALTALASLDPRKVQVVELRFFGGLTVEETAEVLKTSPETVMRDWKMAKVWLYRELDSGRADGS
jgi:RNA polymerase sigma-70 factor (ECF subfamily)